MHSSSTSATSSSDPDLKISKEDLSKLCVHLGEPRFNIDELPKNANIVTLDLNKTDQTQDDSSEELRRKLYRAILEKKKNRTRR